MESELKDLNSDQSKTGHDDVSNKDDRPLLKSDSNADRLATESIEELEKRFAAYVRRDVYGTMGRGDLPLVEKVLLAIAFVTLVPLRVVLATTILVLYYLICKVCTLFSAPNREDEQEDYAHLRGWRRAVIVFSGRLLSRLVLFVFGFYWISETYREPEEERLVDEVNQSIWKFHLISLRAFSFEINFVSGKTSI